MILRLDDDIRSALVDILTAAAAIPPDANIDNYVIIQPYADLGRFREQVGRPLEAGRTSPTTSVEDSRVVLRLSGVEADAVRRVLRAFGESWAGGVPWQPVAEADLELVQDVVDRLV